MGAVTASNLIDAARGSTAKERNANKPKTKPKPSRVTSNQKTNRRGRRITSSSPKLSNIPSKEGTGKGSPNDKKPTTRTSTPKTSSPKTSSPRSKSKPDNRSTLTKEIDGLTKFIATHKGKKGMERGLSQARKSLAAKKKKKSQRSTTMSGNTSGSSRSIG